jgi:hypothetical protein
VFESPLRHQYNQIVSSGAANPAFVSGPIADLAGRKMRASRHHVATEYGKSRGTAAPGHDAAVRACIACPPLSCPQ